MATRRWRRIVGKGLAVGAGLLGAAVCLLVVPISGWPDAGATRPDAAEVQARGEAHFARIGQGENLDRPFPAMALRHDNPSSPEKVELGRLLYFDPILSGANELSCAHCHHPDLGFSDNRRRSMGRGGRGLGPERAGGSALRRGSPTVWNAALNHRQFWDGRAADLEEQAEGPIQDPNEMAQDPAELVQELAAIPEYRQGFEAAFGEEGITFSNVTYAIAAFERTLISDDSPYDRYARGDRAALTAAERRGLNLFRSLKTRCFECHNLPTFNNPDFKIIGVPDTGQGDRGRGEVVPGNDGAFKVPTLRNVALTAPYMHNGIFTNLEQVLDFYSRGGGRGLGLDVPHQDDKIRAFPLSEEEKRDLIAFLHALTDESQKPPIPDAVPSGLPVVPALANQSPEMAAFTPPPPEPPPSPVRRDGNRLLVEPGGSIQAAIDAAGPGDIVEIPPGIYSESLTLDVSGLTLRGIPDPANPAARAVLDGGGERSDAIIGSAGDLLLEGFDVRGYTANGVMINLGRNITFRDLRLEDTGLYGLYPVEVTGVLIEDCEVAGAHDAGIYVGQSRDIVVRGNRAHGNVAGIEIENSLDALVEANEVFDNTGGILVFGLPDNPSKLAARTTLRGNRVYGNNRPNFGDPAAIVSGIPPGSGILVLAADATEIVDNEVRGHESFGIAVLGLDTFFPEPRGYDIDPLSDGTWIHGNLLENNGHDPAPAVREAGYPGADLLWDATGEDNRWQQPEARAVPFPLPAPEWAPWQRRAHGRLWRLLAAL